MTQQELESRYGLAPGILQEYEACGLHPTQDYTQDDLRRLSIFLSLQNAGLGTAQRRAYIRLLQGGAGTAAARRELLCACRGAPPEDLCEKQRQLDLLGRLLCRAEETRKGAFR